MAKVVGVRFKNTPKVYYFAPTDGAYKEGETVIVETAKGMECAIVVFGIKEVDDNDCVLPLKPIVRKATQKDLDNIKKNQAKIPEALRLAEEKVLKHNLKMKFVGCEYSFDGKKVMFCFTAEGRIDFRELVKELASALKVRIELRQVGVRDETKMLGGIAPCGRPCCCGSCMPDFKKVSIKMAKTQGLSLNPGKISGLCGRLMCCLEYENEYYSGVYKLMPKVGATVGTSEGNGTVVSNNMLKLICKVKIVKGDGSEVYKDFDVKDLKFKRQNNAQEFDDKDLDEDIKEILD